MKPIYWSPLHDISDVLRATWFYKNTMLPVDPILANKLEEGYLYMRPWTETWQDELNSCVENGADAEMKIVHMLWEKGGQKAMVKSGPGQDLKKNDREVIGCDEDHYCALTFHENLAAKVGNDESEIKPFRNSGVIYVDATDAQILRPSLLPSASRGRCPLNSIRKGRQIGVPVVRGFNRQIWDKRHMSKQTHFDMRHYIMRPQTGDVVARHGEQICYACAIEESRPNPSDLMLVIHGIGQKLSERMESYHFTHAINRFRRSVNLELNNEDIWPHIRHDHGGIMVLPVNWRSTLSLEDENVNSLSSEDPTTNHYTIKDITPDTIPAIRTLVSDVMMDIPYYLSHHKQKMIQAVVKEANRVYRLWCKNNPGFHESGRVHLLAHSLGSVMALDILSHQPTKLANIDFSTAKIRDDIFEFDTKNLFFCGSPAGLFLLLNKANLLPRRGRDKPGRAGEDWQPGVAGEVDTYGCLAIDNLYNIMHTTDRM
jgi:DDHD domain